MEKISIEGFVWDETERRAWTPDGRWGLVRDEGSRELWLLDADGYPSGDSLTDDDAQHIIRAAGLGEDLRNRWEYFAMAR